MSLSSPSSSSLRRRLSTTTTTARKTTTRYTSSSFSRTTPSRTSRLLSLTHTTHSTHERTLLHGFDRVLQQRFKREQKVNIALRRAFAFCAFLLLLFFAMNPKAVVVVVVSFSSAFLNARVSFPSHPTARMIALIVVSRKPVREL